MFIILSLIIIVAAFNIISGLTILVKRSFMDTNCGIINTSHDPEMKPKDIYEYENNYLLNEIKSSKLENK